MELFARRVRAEEAACDGDGEVLLLLSQRSWF